MKRVIVAAMLLLLGLASVVVLAGCGENEAVAVPAGAVAAVGEGTVTQEQYDEIVAQAKAAYEAQGADFPDAESQEYNTLKANIVSYLVQAELMRQKAAEMDLSLGADEVDERIATIVKEVGGQKKFETLLKQQGVTEEDLRGQLEIQTLQDKVQAKVTEGASVTEAEVKAYYENEDNKSQFVVPATVTARHVLVKTKAQAEKVKALLEADSSDANWKKVAKKYSTDTGSKNTGGSLGSFSEGRMVEAFEDAAFSLKVNQISDPVKTQFGYHIIEVTEKTKGSTTSFEDAKSGIEQQLKSTRQGEAWQKWLEEAKAAIAIGYAAGFNPTELTATPSPAASTTPSPESSN